MPITVIARYGLAASCDKGRREALVGAALPHASTQRVR